MEFCRPQSVKDMCCLLIADRKHSNSQALDNRSLRDEGPTTLIKVDRKILVLCNVVVQQEEYRGLVYIRDLSRHTMCWKWSQSSESISPELTEGPTSLCICISCTPMLEPVEYHPTVSSFEKTCLSAET